MIPAEIATRPLGSPPAVGWCSNCRADPITGLVAFPDFHAAFPSIMQSSLQAGTAIGLAIGDVDNLKTYVETANESDPLSFGHLAGNALMRRFGEVAQDWFWNSASACGLVSTFGGDEIIVAIEITERTSFMRTLVRLRERLNEALPCTVSFAATTVHQAPSGSAEQFYLRAMTTLDRCLFARKSARRASGSEASFLLDVDLVDGRAREAADA